VEPSRDETLYECPKNERFLDTKIKIHLFGAPRRAEGSPTPSHDHIFLTVADAVLKCLIFSKLMETISQMLLAYKKIIFKWIHAVVVV